MASKVLCSRVHAWRFLIYWIRSIIRTIGISLLRFSKSFKVSGSVKLKAEHQKSREDASLKGTYSVAFSDLAVFGFLLQPKVAHYYIRYYRRGICVRPAVVTLCHGHEIVRCWARNRRTSQKVGNRHNSTSLVHCNRIPHYYIGAGYVFGRPSRYVTVMKLSEVGLEIEECPKKWGIAITQRAEFIFERIWARKQL